MCSCLHMHVLCSCAVCCQDFREILVRMSDRGFFHTSRTYYVIKCCWQAVLLLISLAFVAYAKHIGHYMCSAIVLGVFWQQVRSQEGIWQLRGAVKRGQVEMNGCVARFASMLMSHLSYYAL